MMLYCMLLLLIKNPDGQGECWVLSSCCSRSTMLLGAGGQDSSCGVVVRTHRCRGGDFKLSRCFVLFPLRLKNELKILIVIS